METKKILRYFLDERRLSVNQLSQKSGVPAKTIYHWLNGQKPGNIEYVFRVCEALEINIETLFDRRIPERMPSLKLNFNDIQTDLELGLYEVILRRAKEAGK